MSLDDWIVSLGFDPSKISYDNILLTRCLFSTSRIFVDGTRGCISVISSAKLIRRLIFLLAMVTSSRLGFIFFPFLIVILDIS
ncbi:hypothetical protein LINPERHAP2_LOCUS23821 [Linum perenne]